MAYTTRSFLRRRGFKKPLPAQNVGPKPDGHLEMVRGAMHVWQGGKCVERRPC